MNVLQETVKLTQKLIKSKSVTPKDDGAINKLQKYLSELGFKNHKLIFGSNKNGDKILNLFSIKNPNKKIKKKHKVLCFAGHTDVVPTGNINDWKFNPFKAKVSKGRIYGRGAADMKGAIAAWTIACKNVLKKNDLNIALALLITGDEEGIAINGTTKVVDWIKKKKIKINHCIVGEPTNPSYIGEMIKVGRRGSLTFSIEVFGKSGHVAYPHLAHNPITNLIIICNKLKKLKLNKKAKNFPTTNLEITSIDTGNKANNVIPSSSIANINIRYNTSYTEKYLLEKIKKICKKESIKFKLNVISSNIPFYTKPDNFQSILEKCIFKVTKKKPTLSTSGGTSDARFIKSICPVIEFGSVGKTMHQLNENIFISDLIKLQKIYEEIILTYNNLYK